MKDTLLTLLLLVLACFITFICIRLIKYLYINQIKKNTQKFIYFVIDKAYVIFSIIKREYHYDETHFTHSGTMKSTTIILDPETLQLKKSISEPLLDYYIMAQDDTKFFIKITAPICGDDLDGMLFLYFDSTNIETMRISDFSIMEDSFTFYKCLKYTYSLFKKLNKVKNISYN